MGFRQLPTATKIYVGYLILAGITAIGLAAFFPLTRLPDLPLLIYMALAAFAARLYVKIPYTDVHISMETAFVFLILIQYGPLPAVLADALGKFILSYGNVPKENRFKIYFNMASGILSALGAWLVYERLFVAPAREMHQYILPMIAMTATYYLINTLTVAIAICITEKTGLARFWIRNFLPTGLGYLVACSIAAFLLIMDEQGQSLAFVVTVPLVLLAYFAQKVYSQKEEETKKHIRELEQLNLSLQQSILEQNRTENEKRKLEAQLAQSQKMEAIGRLAGGVAHDFNNLLTGINGYAELILSSLDPADPMMEYIQEIERAGARAADLTGQLLAFSRQQVILPRIINLNAIIADTRKLLRRLIGEDIELVFEPEKDLGLIKADAGQIEQVLINLAVNARDAMPDGGVLTLRTENFVLQAEEIGKENELKPGDFVLLSVNDNGVGMDSETRDRIFEPFFTTKAEGKGTGLGLATVYGVVMQNKGAIRCQSEPGKGTSFEILLPRVAPAVEGGHLSSVRKLPKGAQTVLLVEDEKIVRELARKILEKQGYHLLAAQDGSEAAAICRDHPGEIDLLLTDLVMPDISGKKLADQLRELNPGMRVLFMSGYNEEIIDPKGVLMGNVNFIQKPFSVEGLAKKVHQILNG